MIEVLSDSYYRSKANLQPPLLGPHWVQCIIQCLELATIVAQ